MFINKLVLMFKLFSVIILWIFQTFTKMEGFSCQQQLFLKCFNRIKVLIPPIRRLFLSICFISLFAVCQLLFFNNYSLVSTTTTYLTTQTTTKTKQKFKRFPDSLIIGVRKGGTRALLEALSLHPNIKIAKHEVHFFDKDKNFQKGQNWYLKQMPEANINDIIIEKTPAYFTANPLVPERVFNFNSKLKFILILRSPIIRTISDFTQILQTKKEKNKTTINLEKMSLIKINNSIKLNKRFKPIRNSLYSEHLIRWLKYFPLKQFLILDGEKFIKDPLSQLKIVEQFLNLKPLINSNQLIFNFEKKFFCFRQNITTTTINCLGNSKGRKHIKITNKFRYLLTKYFRPYNYKLFNLINRKFKNWE